eukprot:scaffold71157_cov22-Tisochrysis_lutea.AAC.1
MPCDRQCMGRECQASARGAGRLTVKSCLQTSILTAGLRGLHGLDCSGFAAHREVSTNEEAKEAAFWIHWKGQLASACNCSDIQ